MERWCSAKYYTRENCGYSLNDLRETIPKAFESIPTATIDRFYQNYARIIDTYDDGLQYGTKEFASHVYKNHRQVIDSSKWWKFEVLPFNVPYTLPRLSVLGK